MTTVNYYSADGTKIVSTRTYRTMRLALAACKRAAARHVIAGIARVRLASDAPSTHS